MKRLQIEKTIWQEINNDQATLLYTNKNNCTETYKCNFVARQKEELSGSTRN